MTDDKALDFGKETPKAEKYGWVTVDRPGSLMMLPKQILKIDHAYQRKNVSERRVCAIRASWSWMALGVLLVMKRRDGTLWVFDGQHRKLAADERDDIQYLPCMVFDCDGDEGAESKREALAFILANTNRGPMDKFSKFTAALVSEDATALGIKLMVESSGYSIVKGGCGEQQMACIEAVEVEYLKDAGKCAAIWGLCVSICDGKPVNNKLFTGLAILERRLKRGNHGTLLAGALRDKLVAAGPAQIERDIRDRVAELGQGGGKAWASGILSRLNHRVRNKIPDMFGGGVHNDGDEE